MKKEYKIYRRCRFCNSVNLHKILDLGKLPLAGGFIKNEKDLSKEKKYPLELYYCSDCFLVQTNYVINADVLFKHYYYSSSSINTLVEHFKEFAKLLMHKFKNSKNLFVVEIGSNDGIFLKLLKNNGFKVLGVDPSSVAKNLNKNGIPTINNYFTEKLAQKIIKKIGHADIIVSSNTLAHIEDMHDVFRGIYSLLKPNGILIFENHYLVNLIKEVQYDMVYHEHQYYYSLLALKNVLKTHNLEIYDAQIIPTHAGSIRIFVKKNTNLTLKPTKRLKNLIEIERNLKINKLSTYLKFEKAVIKSKNDLIKLLNKLKKQQAAIIGYGASGRGTILANYCGLNGKYLSFMVDDSLLKQNLYMPGTHLKIYSSKKMNDEKIDYALLFAWSFAKEINIRNKKFIEKGGKFIIPIPKATILK